MAAELNNGYLSALVVPSRTEPCLFMICCVCSHLQTLFCQAEGCIRYCLIEGPPAKCGECCGWRTCEGSRLMRHFFIAWWNIEKCESGRVDKLQHFTAFLNIPKAFFIAWPMVESCSSCMADSLGLSTHLLGALCVPYFLV